MSSTKYAVELSAVDEMSIDKMSVDKVLSTKYLSTKHTVDKWYAIHGIYNSHNDRIWGVNRAAADAKVVLGENVNIHKK